MDQATLDALQKWKDYRYRDHDLPFGSAVRSLVDQAPLIEARQSDTRRGDWVVCLAGTTTPANFVYAGVFSEADPYETGNFVFGKEAADPQLPQSRVARFPGFKPAYSYAIETYHDKEVWELQTILDTYMETVDGFNSRGVKRREWQNGSTWHIRYYFRTPIFLSCEGRGGHPDPPDGLHEWVVAGHKSSKTYRANPIRPEVCGLSKGRMHKIGDCDPRVLEYGDVVNIVFTLVYTEDKDDWGPVPHVSHVIRVQRANREAYPLTSTVVAKRPPDEGLLCIGAVVDVEEATADVRVGTTDVASRVGIPDVGSTTLDKGKAVDRLEADTATLRGSSEEEASKVVGAQNSEDHTVAQGVSSAKSVAKLGRIAGAEVEEGGSSGSEMDVDDDGKVAGGMGRSRVLATRSDLQPPLGSGGSSVPGVPRGEKRRATGESDTTDDVEERERARRARVVGTGGGRRGVKGGK